MKQFVFFLIAIFFLSACSKTANLRQVVTIDFSNAAAPTSVTFIGEQGQGTFAFYYTGARTILQKALPPSGTYTIVTAYQGAFNSSCFEEFSTGQKNGLDAANSDTLTNNTLSSNYNFSIQCR